MGKRIALSVLLCILCLTGRGIARADMLYLYAPLCEKCAHVEAFLEGLPEVWQQGLEKLDITEDPSRAFALFESYQVPDGKRVTPLILLPGGYLSGEHEITQRLEEVLKQGWGEGKIREGTQETKLPVTLLSAALAGLVAGCNGCALSMLLLFLSLVLPFGEKAGRNALAYLAGKGICIFLIGFGFLSALRYLSGAGFLYAIRWIVAGVGIGLALMNFYDAWRAYRGEFGEMRNQLPRGLRTRLQGYIRAHTTGRVLPLLSLLLGALVGAGEFLCAGQIYLAFLMEAASALSVQAVAALVLYCAAFLLPSAAVVAVCMMRNKTGSMAVFLSKHTWQTKLVTGFMMLLLILLSFVV